MAKLFLRVCAWHEFGQLVLPIAEATHGCCPVCGAIKLGVTMKHSSPEWPYLIRDGGWDYLPASGYWGRLHRVLPDGSEQHIIHAGSEAAWRLFVGCSCVFEGDLTECLEKAN